MYSLTIHFDSREVENPILKTHGKVMLHGRVATVNVLAYGHVNVPLPCSSSSVKSQ